MAEEKKTDACVLFGKGSIMMVTYRNRYCSEARNKMDHQDQYYDRDLIVCALQRLHIIVLRPHPIHIEP